MAEPIHLTIFGDFCPINRAASVQSNLPASEIYNFHQLLSNQDIVIANLECPVESSGQPISKVGPNIQIKKSSLDLLKSFFINSVCLANNHIMDYGIKGLQETISSLIDLKISYVGAGITKNEASTPLFITIKGKSIAIINICEEEFNVDFNYKSGANHFDLIELVGIIEDCKQKADFIFIIYHGGVEYYNLPTPEMQRRLRFLAEQGCSAIVCHHSHVISGMEKWNNVPIFYGLGNFVFDWPKKAEDWHLGTMIQFVIAPSGELEFQYSFFRQFHTQPGVFLLEGKELEQATENFKSISRQLSDISYVETKWTALIKRIEKSILADLFSLNKWHRRLMYYKIFPNLMNTPGKRNQLFNRFFCESHREIMYYILKHK